MEIISNPTLGEIKRAARALIDGHLVAFPTETVYGLGADAANEKAVSRIYSAKGRPTDHPLIVHISSINELDKWAIDIPEYAIKLARDFWPGPMTLILKRSDLAKDFITGGQNNIGLRVPDQSVALALLSEFEILGGFGIAAPSANRFGAVSPTTADAVEDELDKFLVGEDLILDDGPSFVGVESTIIESTKDYPIVLRPGAVTNEMIIRTVGFEIPLNLEKNETRVSGLLGFHYSPRARIILDLFPNSGDGFIAMANFSTPPGAIRLSAPKTIEEFAKDLYLALRNGDKQGLNFIFVLLPSGGGLAIAIRDRLEKAAKKFK